MKVNNFSEFSRQNSKGIILNYTMLLYRIIKSSWVLIPLFFTTKKDNFNLPYIYGSIAILAVVLLIISILIYLNYKFKIKDNHFILKNGVLNKTNTSISFDRIQNINFKQNLFQQILGVLQVEIETAGAKKTEISIKALTRKKAEELKEYILKNQIENEEELNLEEDFLIKEEKKTILKIGLPELIKVSLTENHIKSLGIAIGLYFSITSQLSNYLKDLQIENLINNTENYFLSNSDTIFNSFYVIAVLVIIGLLFSIVVSTVIVFLFHFDLKVSEKNEALEINQGLFTKRNSILKKEKVQYITLSSNPLKKLMGINSVNFKQAAGEGKKKKKQIRVVGCKQEQNNILKNLLFGQSDFKELKIYKPDNYFIFQIIVRSLLFISLVNLALFILTVDNKLLINAVIIFPIVGLLSYLKYKKSYFKINEDIIVKGYGSLETHTTYFEYFKIQNIKLKQTIFQKRKNVYNLVLQTASGKLKIPCVPKDQAFTLYNHILKKSQVSKKNWI